LIKHSRHYWLVSAESHLSRRLFTTMVRRINLPPLPAESGESAPGLGFSDKRVTGRKRGSCGLWGSRERHRWPFPRPAEAPCTANPTDNCVRRRSDICCRLARRSITEIPAWPLSFRSSPTTPRPKRRQTHK
jgi:hypothetical protein